MVKKLAIAVKELATNPTPNGSKKLSGYPFYRVRVGNYRIVYRYDNKTLYVTIIEKRDKVYTLLRKFNWNVNTKTSLPDLTDRFILDQGHCVQIHIKNLKPQFTLIV